MKMTRVRWLLAIIDGEFQIFPLTEEDPYPPVPPRWEVRPVSLDFGPCGASYACMILAA